MIGTSLHITSEGGGGAGTDLADFYLAGLLALGVLYLSLELRQKGTVKRLIIPISVILIASSGLAYTFGVLPAIPTPAPPGSVFVYMTVQGFNPRNITVVTSANSTVAWQNSDSEMHTAHADLAEFDRLEVQPGQTKWHNFTRLGVFTYHCDPHPWMTGTVTVSSP